MTQTPNHPTVMPAPDHYDCSVCGGKIDKAGRFYAMQGIGVEIMQNKQVSISEWGLIVCDTCAKKINDNHKRVAAALRANDEGKEE